MNFCGRVCGDIFIWAMLEHNSTPNIGEGIKLFNERDAVRYENPCFSWKQPIWSYDIIYSTVRIDIQINSSRLTEDMTSYMTVNGCKTVIEKDTAFG